MPLVFCAFLSACGGGGDPPSDATASNIAVQETQPGSTPFLSLVKLRGDGLAKLAAVRYTIEPKAGTASSPVDVTYEMSALARRGYAIPEAQTVGLPVFGLYANYLNKLTIELHFMDRSIKVMSLEIATSPYVDPSGFYDHPTILTKRVPGSKLGVNFFAMKGSFGSPVVVDTDGEIRWVIAQTAALTAEFSISVAFHDNTFIMGNAAAPTVTRLELDGNYKTTTLAPPSYLAFHHNIDPGKYGLLAELNVSEGAATNLVSAPLTTPLCPGARWGKGMTVE